MWSKGIKIAFFPKKLQKKHPAAGLSSVIRLNYIDLLNTSTKFDIFTF